MTLKCEYILSIGNKRLGGLWKNNVKGNIKVILENQSKNNVKKNGHMVPPRKIRLVTPTEPRVIVSLD